MKRPCTCRSPPAVNLTQEFIQQLQETDSKKSSVSRQQLLRNLEQSGWSLIQINVSEISPTEDPLSDVLKSHSHWKESLVQLFQQQQQQTISSTNRNVVYRQAESGAPGTTVEPKESWEMQRCSCGKEVAPKSVFKQ